MKDYKVYTVGGFVRDKLMGRDPKDVDYVVVGSTPEKMLAMGFKQVGADFPVFLNERGEEFALARTERKTGDGYLGFAVETDDVTLEEDLARRDLTINAMAMDEDGNIIDPFGGQQDLALKQLRHVGPAFGEDPLRVIRLGRFFTRYEDFTINVDTLELAMDMVASGQLNHLATERFWAELEKVFEEDKPELFFDYLQGIAGDVHIDFFAKLLPLLTPTVLPWVMEVARFSKISDNPLMNFTALVGLDDATIQTADARTQVLHHNIFQLTRLSFGRVTADRIYALLKGARAWSEGTAFQDLLNASTVAVSAGEPFVLGTTQLLLAKVVTASITAADFIDELGPGKELGLAIEKGRKEAIARLFNLRDDDMFVPEEL